MQSVELLLLSLYLVVVAVGSSIYAQTGNLGVVVNKDTGNYSVTWAGQTILLSSVTRAGLHVDSAWCTGANQCLTAEVQDSAPGTDKLGYFDRIVIRWTRLSDNQPLFITAFRVYAHFIVFEQTFAQAVRGCSLGSPEAPLSAFPVFDTQKSPWLAGQVGAIYWSDVASKDQAVPLAKLVAQGGLPAWKCTTIQGQAASCSFPGSVIAMLDQDQTIVLVSSALTDFPTTVQSVLPTGEWCAGILGTIAAVPAGYHLETIIFVGTSGINQAFRGWGDALLTYNGKHRTSFNASIVTSHLGYSTTGFYFYSPMEGQNFQDTILAVHDDAQTYRIPYRYYLLDSWWYGEYVLKGSGVLNWDESAAKTTDQLDHQGRFPQGLKWLSQQLGGREGSGNFVQHMGKWRSDTPYAANASWGWQVYARPDASSPVSTALTNSTLFWNELIGQATRWGLTTLKQDHTQEQIPQTTLCMQQLGYTASVLQAQARALANNDATLQAGGYTLLGWLNSVTLGQVVTHARTSDDYACWFNNKTGVGLGCSRGMNNNYYNYAVAPQGMLSWALGMLPYKDSFYSSTTEVSKAPCMSCLFTNWTEPYPVVHALASVLSAGPVAPGDGVGLGDNSLIMKTCRADGLLLKPDRPATPIDAYFSRRIFGPDLGDGQIWSTEVTLQATGSADGQVWYYAVGMDLASNFSMGVPTLLQAAQAWAPANGPVRAVSEADFVVYDFMQGPSSAEVINGSAPSSLHFLAGPDYGTFRYYVVAPTFASGWAFLGEPSKFIALSAQRFSQLQINAQGFSITAFGQLGEVTDVVARAPNGTLVVSVCM